MNQDYETSFGANLRKLRKKKSLTQDQLAAQLQINGCDITRSALAKIEVGQRHLYPDEIRLLRELLDVSFDEMFYFEQP
jgi:transcriptional regulator with XRE-family HTH domain